MSSYWISDDWKVQVKTLESYLRDALNKDIQYHCILAEENDNGNIQFNIHPLQGDGSPVLGDNVETIDYKVDDNTLWPAHEAFEKPKNTWLVFRVMDDGHVVSFDMFATYVNQLEELRSAVEDGNTEEVKNILNLIHEMEDEL